MDLRLQNVCKICPVKLFAVRRGTMQRICIAGRVPALRPSAILLVSPQLGACHRLRRALSTEPPTLGGMAGLVKKTVAIVAQGLNTYGPAFGLGVGGVVVVYGMSSLALSATGAFMSLTLSDALYWGFATGFVSAGLLGFGALRGYRSMTIRTEPVFRMALAKLRENERVSGALGANIAPGTLKAYDRVPGHISSSKLAWVDPRVQMIFQVVGKDTGREGMVSILAVLVFAWPEPARGDVSLGLHASPPHLLTFPSTSITSNT